MFLLYYVLFVVQLSFVHKQGSVVPTLVITLTSYMWQLEGPA